MYGDFFLHLEIAENLGIVGVQPLSAYEITRVEGYDPNGAGYGQHVIINHGFGYETLYGHMSKILVHAGQKVKRGSMIGLVGSTGLSTAPHLHYEVIKNGKKIDPINFFHNDLNSAEYAKILEIAKHSNQSFD